MPFYFAYGSNMDEKQMKERCPNSKRIGKGILADHKIGFTRFSKKRDSAVADILVSTGDLVWGIIYELTENDLAKLDVVEGHPRAYVRKKMTILKVTKNHFYLDDDMLISKEFEKIECETYEVVNKTYGLYPNLSYLRIMLDAAFDDFFPMAYQRKLQEFGKENYHQKLSIIIDELIQMEDLLKRGNFPIKVKKQKEWGGANLVITGNQTRKDQLNHEYPHDLVVLTPHWRELSWIVDTIYWNERMYWQIDYSNKHYILEQFGLACLKYQEMYPNDDSPSGICLAVLYSAYKVFTIDFYKEF